MAAAALDRGAALARQEGFDGFDIPIAQLVPEELIERGSRLIVAEFLQSLVHVTSHSIHAAEDPPIDEGQVIGGGSEWVFGSPEVFGKTHEDKPGCVPDFGTEGLVSLDPLQVEGHVRSRRGHRGQGEPEGIGAEPIHEIKGVHGVAPCLAHLSPLFVPHQPIEVDLVKGDPAHELKSHHDHPGDPEE